MDINRLIQIMNDWAHYMNKPSHKLGYSSNSSHLFLGNVSSHEAFEHMLDIADYNNVKAIESLIESLDSNQVMAINHRWLGSIKPKQYEHHLMTALDQLSTMCDKRGIV